MKTLGILLSLPLTLRDDILVEKQEDANAEPADESSAGKLRSDLSPKIRN